MSGEAFEIKCPRVNPNDQKVDLLRWRVPEGSRVEKGTPVADIESSKATVGITSEKDGYLFYSTQAGQSVPVGGTLGFISAKPERPTATPTASHARFPQSHGSLPTTAAPTVVALSSAAAPIAPAAAPLLSEERFGELLEFSPQAQHLFELLVQEGRLKPDSLQGYGLVTKDILESLVGASASVPVVQEAPTPILGPVAGFRSEALPGTKKKEIEILTAGQKGLINSSLTIGFSSAGIRTYLKENNLIGGQILPLIVLELAQLLKDLPRFCSFYENGFIHFHDQVNVGVAIDFDDSLRVPVIRRADEKTAAEIFAELTANGVKYLNEELLPEDLSGGTVTVTDLSAQEIIHFQPLLNERQAIILGIGGDKSAPGHPMTLTVVFDHRILSGRAVGEFLRTLRTRLLKYDNPSTPVRG